MGVGGAFIFSGVLCLLVIQKPHCKSAALERQRDGLFETTLTALPYRFHFEAI
jgi:hypothetical protein